jgi:hypothetical protein
MSCQETKLKEKKIRCELCGQRRKERFFSVNDTPGVCNSCSGYCDTCGCMLNEIQHCDSCLNDLRPRKKAKMKFLKEIRSNLEVDSRESRLLAALASLKSSFSKFVVVDKYFTEEECNTLSILSDDDKLRWGPINFTQPDGSNIPDPRLYQSHFYWNGTRDGMRNITPIRQCKIDWAPTQLIIIRQNR